MLDEDGSGYATLAVIAHSLISSASVITNAVQSVLDLGESLGDEDRNEMLRLALTQAEYLGEVLKDVARGLPGEIIEALDNLSARRPTGGEA